MARKPQKIILFEEPRPDLWMTRREKSPHLHGLGRGGQKVVPKTQKIINIDQRSFNFFFLSPKAKGSTGCCPVRQVCFWPPAVDPLDVPSTTLSSRPCCPRVPRDEGRSPPPRPPQVGFWPPAVDALDVQRVRPLEMINFIRSDPLDVQRARPLGAFRIVR